MTNYIRKLLNDAAAAGFQLVVEGGGEEPDYVGFHPAEAEEAINAVEESELSLVAENGARRGFAIIIDGVAPDERIMDCDSNGWVANWTKENIPT